MADPKRVSAFLQERLGRLGLNEVSAVDAAVWLDEAGLLADAPSRPGLPLRNLLRTGAIAAAEQRPPKPNGRWFIRRAGADSALPGAVDARAKPAAATVRRDAPDEVSQSPFEFSVEGLRALGFQGFKCFKSLDLRHVPTGAGVYVVLRERDDRPKFLRRNPAGWFKGQDPTVPTAELEVAWPDGAKCVYIGKADIGTSGRRGLRKRIEEFRRYGDGEPVGHRGGRRIWQLADAGDFVIAWRATPGSDPEVLEAQLLRAFVAQHGRRPIGNRTTGRRL